MLKRLILTGAFAWLIAFALSEVNLSHSARKNPQTWAGAVFPFESLVYAQNQKLMSEQAFKNIQVLKGIPVDEFMGTMGLFSAALNVCCGDCHVGAGGSDPKWEADPPRKKVARRMVQVMNNVNKTSFGGAQMGTCWTCHRCSAG